MDICYRPVTLLDPQGVDTFRCLPVGPDSHGPVVRGKGALRHHDDTQITAERNAEILTRAFADLTNAGKQGHRLDLIVPVNSFALADSEGVTAIVGAFRRLGAEHRGAVIAELYQFPSPLTLDFLDRI
mgnify:CR=1 FL=1